MEALSDPPAVRIVPIHDHFLGHGLAEPDPDARWYWRHSIIEPSARGASEVRRLWLESLDYEVTVSHRPDRYPETVLHFASGLRVDLRAPLTPDDREALADIAPHETFAVITASNPGRRLEDLENNRRRDELSKEIGRRGASPIPVKGCSPDGAHCEDSFCVDLPKDESLALARRFGQEAIFWYHGGAFWLVAARENGSEAMRLPSVPR